MLLVVVVSLGLVALLGGLVLVSRAVSKDYVLDQASRDARRMANGLAAPLVNDQVRGGDPAALRRLGTAMMVRVRDGSVRHIHITDRDGRILWADQPSQIGRRFDLPSETIALFDTLTEVAEVSSLDREEHRGIDTGETLLEVYAGALDSQGEPFLFEIYASPASVTEHRNAVLMALLPVVVGLLAVLLLTGLPALWIVTRRMRRTRRENARIVENALSAWHAERRRIAQDLHDGVVQNLSAVSYALPGVLDMIPDEPTYAHAKTVGRQLNRMLQNDLSALRTLITDQLPDLEGDGLRAALSALADRATASGLDVCVAMDHDLRLDATVAGVVYRIVREGLRNVERHAQARSAEVVVAAVDGDHDLVQVRVSDDGQGLGEEEAGVGHVGLRLLAGLMLDLGGTLELRDGRAGGTVLEARVPKALVRS